MTDSQRGELREVAYSLAADMMDVMTEYSGNRRGYQGLMIVDQDDLCEAIEKLGITRATEAAPSGAAQPDGWMLLRDGKRVSVNNTDWWAIESKDLKHNGGRYEVVPLYRVAPSPSGPGEAQAGNKIVQPCGCCTYSLQARHLCPEHTNMVDIDV